MNKYGPRVFGSDLINTRGHWAVGTIWSTQGSQGEYLIEMKENGFTCSCPAFRKCKHIHAVEQRFVGE